MENVRNPKVKSQGQEFQESQGQIPRSNPKVKCENKKWETGKNWKKPEKPEKWESVTKIKNHKHLKRY